MPLEQVDGHADLDSVGPDLVHGLEALHDALHVSAHQRHGRRWVDILERYRPGLAVDDGHEARADHADGAVGPVLVLAHCDLFKSCFSFLFIVSGSERGDRIKHTAIPT